MAVASSVPPPKVSWPAVGLAGTLPRSASDATASVPALMRVTPEYVLVPDRVERAGAALGQADVAAPSVSVPENVVVVLLLPSSGSRLPTPVLVTVPVPASEPIESEKPPRSKVATDATLTALLEPTRVGNGQLERAVVDRRRAGVRLGDAKRQRAGALLGHAAGAGRSTPADLVDVAGAVVGQREAGRSDRAGQRQRAARRGRPSWPRRASLRPTECCCWPRCAARPRRRCRCC